MGKMIVTTGAINPFHLQGHIENQHSVSKCQDIKGEVKNKVSILSDEWDTQTILNYQHNLIILRVVLSALQVITVQESGVIYTCT